MASAYYEMLQMEKRIADLETKLAAAERDAGRYRWLIENGNQGLTKRQRVVLYLCRDLIWNIDEPFGVAIDRAISGPADSTEGDG